MNNENEVSETSQNTEYPEPKRQNIYKALFFALISIGALSGVIYFFNNYKIQNKNESEDHNERPAYVQPPQEYVPPQREYEPPARYVQRISSGNLTLNAHYRTDLINNIVIEGYIGNPTSATFKDVKISVEFYSSTGSTIAQRIYTVYDYFPPHMNKSFKIKETERNLRRNTERLSSKIYNAYQVY